MAVPTFFTTTVVPGRTSPDQSATVPCMVPPATWAVAADGASSARAKITDPMPVLGVMVPPAIFFLMIRRPPRSTPGRTPIAIRRVSDAAWQPSFLRMTPAGLAGGCRFCSLIAPGGRMHTAPRSNNLYLQVIGGMVVGGPFAHLLPALGALARPL